MSDLTRRLLATVDIGRVAKARRENFMLLHARLAGLNLLSLDATAIAAPMCYPLLIPKPGLRKFLIGKRIFIPQYWEGVGRGDGFEIERFIVDDLVPLPCDQRYGPSDMRRVLDALDAFFNQ